ncbi:MAG: hypothetical protein RBU37_22845 [Myxococcota bacterium]|jgi:hypothetical protein|nr:hypothetical protein [Myxococcota bacterium]
MPSPKYLLSFTSLLVLLTPSQLWAQESQSGALEFSGVYARSHSDRDMMGIAIRAMAVDRVPGTVVGRFGELRAGGGAELGGEHLWYDLAFNLGVGLATDYFVLFVASGIFFDAMHSIDDASEHDQVEPGVGHPLRLGLWVTPSPQLYVYTFAEPAWVWWAETRQVDDFEPFGFGEEFRLRAGVGFDVDELSFRVDYVYQQAGPTPWHFFSLGVGPRALLQ